MLSIKSSNSIYHLWKTKLRFLHQHNIHSDFYILNPQTNTQKQKLLREEMNQKKKEPKKKKNEELRPLKLHRGWFQPSKSPLDFT